jgi:hypothetical protein
MELYERYKSLQKESVMAGVHKTRPTTRRDE